MLLRPQLLRPQRLARAVPSRCARVPVLPTLQRPITTLPSNTRRILTSQIPALRSTFRRSYADQAPQAILSPAPKPKRRFRVLRFLWRLTYGSLIVGAVYLGYTIYDLQTPSDQFDPDPSKKTLVILGRIDLQLRRCDADVT